MLSVFVRKENNNFKKKDTMRFKIVKLFSGTRFLFHDQIAFTYIYTRCLWAVLRSSALYLSWCHQSNKAISSNYRGYCRIAPYCMVWRMFHSPFTSHHYMYVKGTNNSSTFQLHEWRLIHRCKQDIFSIDMFKCCVK